MYKIIVIFKSGKMQDLYSIDHNRYLSHVKLLRIERAQNREISIQYGWPVFSYWRVDIVHPYLQLVECKLELRTRKEILVFLGSGWWRNVRVEHPVCTWRWHLFRNGLIRCMYRISCMPPVRARKWSVRCLWDRLGNRGVLFLQKYTNIKCWAALWSSNYAK